MSFHTVTITGGAGFLGQKLAQQIVKQGLKFESDQKSVVPDKIYLVDQVKGNLTGSPFSWVVGDIRDPSLIEECINDQVNSVFHLAAVVSAGAEADFDLGMSVNIEATKQILERCKTIGTNPKFIFTSSVAVFGGAGSKLPSTAATRPLSSYGTQKAVGELLVNDYTRKGFIDGRAFRLPTVVVRPGKPNKAASSFFSSIIREPLSGKPAICPVKPELRAWLASPNTVIKGLLHGHDLPTQTLPSFRTFNLPGINISVSEMVEAFTQAGGDASLIDWKYDRGIDDIVASWPAEIDVTLEQNLGFPSDPNFSGFISQFLEESSVG